MMKTRIVAALMAVVALLAGVGASTALAAPPSAVEIDIIPTTGPPCFFQCGTWTATGAITDSGTYERVHGATSPPDRPFGTTGPYREEFLLTSGLGTFTVDAEERAGPVGSEGVWQIHAGSGVYESASGHGTSSFIPPVLVLVLTGVASTD